MLRLRVTVEPDGVSGRFKGGITLLEAARKLGVRLDALCDGRGLCGKCRIVVRDSGGKVYRPSEAEKKRLSPQEIEQGYRLACMLRPRGDISVYVPSSSRVPQQRLQTQGMKLHVTLRPAFKKHLVQVPKPTITDQRPDQDRLLDALQEAHGLSGLRLEPYALRKLPSSIRDAGGVVTVTLDHEGWIVDVEPGDTRAALYGAAVDIGTTKIAYYLLSLVTGEEVAVTSMMNPQRAFGEDVMTRLTYANRGEKSRGDLQEKVVNALNKLTREACEKAGADPNSIIEMVAVGNTAMHHLFLGLETKYLALSPYTQVLRTSLHLHSHPLGLRIHPNGFVTTLPTIRSFVGADNTAVCLVTRITDRDKPTLILDVGTNTEIDCGGRGLGVYVTSTPSGPAFEGWATRCGMTAAPGAIERVFIDPETLEVMYRTIGDKPPIGICGSGFIDILAEMFKNGILDHRTRLNKTLAPGRVRKGVDGVEFILARREEAGGGRNIVITQRDVGELVKAKAAIHAGITLLLGALNLKVESLEEVLMAGAFGSYIDPENAVIIGLLPDINLNKVRVIGNAAGSGAKAALLNIDERRRVEETSSKVRFIELATDPQFVKEYVDSMYIPHKNLSAYRRTLSALGMKQAENME